MKFLIPAFLAILSSRAIAEVLPLPPIPPDHPQVGEAAPMPDFNAQPPVTAASDKPSVDVRLYRAKSYAPGFGFAPGSRYQDSEERKPIQTPGLSIQVPLN